MLASASWVGLSKFRPTWWHAANEVTNSSLRADTSEFALLVSARRDEANLQPSDSVA